MAVALICAISVIRFAPLPKVSVACTLGTRRACLDAAACVQKGGILAYGARAAVIVAGVAVVFLCGACTGGAAIFAAKLVPAVPAIDHAVAYVCRRDARVLRDPKRWRCFAPHFVRRAAKLTEPAFVRA